MVVIHSDWLKIESQSELSILYLELASDWLKIKSQSEAPILDLKATDWWLKISTFPLSNSDTHDLSWTN